MDKAERKRLWRIGCDQIQRESRQLHNQLAAANPHLNWSQVSEELPTRMTAEQQAFIQDVIARARSMQLAVTGDSTFQVVVQGPFSDSEAIDLNPFFGQAYGLEAVSEQLHRIRVAQEGEMELAATFVTGRLDFRSVHGEDAIRNWESELAAFPETGWFPVLLSSDMSKTAINSRLAFASRTFAEDVVVVHQFDCAAWLAQQKADFANDGWLNDSIAGDPQSETCDSHQLSIHFTSRGNCVRNRVLMVKLRLAESWQVPILLQFGGWNDAPEPIAQAAMLKSWHSRYGAVVAGIGSDTVEMAVSNPPANLDDATELAWEQYLFCPDIVHQGVGTIGALATSLVGSRYWFFWWD